MLPPSLTTTLRLFTSWSTVSLYSWRYYNQFSPSVIRCQSSIARHSSFNYTLPSITSRSYHQSFPLSSAQPLSIVSSLFTAPTDPYIVRTMLNLTDAESDLRKIALKDISGVTNSTYVSHGVVGQLTMDDGWWMMDDGWWLMVDGRRWLMMDFL